MFYPSTLPGESALLGGWRESPPGPTLGLVEGSFAKRSFEPGDRGVPCVYLAGEDGRATQTIDRVAAAAGLRTRILPATLPLGDVADLPSGCLVLIAPPAVAPPLDLLDELRRCGGTTPVIVFAAEPTPPQIVAAMRRGAFDVHPWDASDAELLASIHAAIQLDGRSRRRRRALAAAHRAYTMLSDQELAVLAMVVHGAANKTIAHRLAVSVRTIENRRRSLYAKFAVTCAVQLTTVVCQLIQAGLIDLNSSVWNNRVMAPQG